MRGRETGAFSLQGLTLLALFAALGIYAAVAASDSPSSAELEAQRIRGAELLINRSTPRDGYAVWPVWDDQARVGLEELTYLGGEPIDPWDRHLVERVWLLTTSGDSETAAASLFGPRVSLRSESRVDTSADVSVAEVRFPRPDSVVWDGWLNVEEATVHRGDLLCDTWTSDAWHCGRYNEFIFVGARFREMDQEPRRCIAMNAPERGEWWDVNWTVPAGHRLRLKAGNTYDAVRATRGSAVALEVRWDGEVVLQDTFGPDDSDYRAFETPVLGTEGEGSLSIRVRADNFFDRFFCVRPQLVTASADL